MSRIKVVGSMFRDLSTLDNEEWTLTKEREASKSYECVVTRVDLLKKENKIEHIFFIDVEK